jgi:phospholipase/carboxylesterase
VIETDLFKSHFIPAVNPSEKLMIVLHGKGDSLKPFQDFNCELEIENMNFLVLNAPRKYMGGYSWYGDPPFQHTGVLKIREKMFKLLDELKELGWKPENIYLFGFSQGCLVSCDLALHYPQKLGGVIGISGYFHFYPRWKQNVSTAVRKTPWLLTHGRRDEVLPIDETKYGVEKLRQMGLQIDWIESDKEHVLEETEYPIIRQWVQEKTKYLQRAQPQD